MSTFSAFLSRADFRRFGTAFAFSLLLHVTVAAVLLPALIGGARTDTSLLAAAPIRVEIRRSKTTPRPAATPRPTPSATPIPGANRGTLRLSQANRDGSGARAGHRRPAGPRTRSARNDTAPGGGSPTPDKNLQGSRGTRGQVRPIEDILFTGGGRGGAGLPRHAPRTGGGSGKTHLALIPTLTAKIIDAETTFLPLTGAGTVEGSTGIGFERREGIGTKPEAREAVASMQQADAGKGIGASADLNAANTGTISPGGGKGDGAPLPGTGGMGTGVGKGAGNGIGDGPGGDGRGGGGPGDGDGGRGALFGAEPLPAAGVPTAAPLHIVYILDVSLSMKDNNKLAAAKAALKAALSELKPHDSFNIVPFYGVAQALNAVMRPVTPANIAAACTYVDNLELGEGTNLEAGLQMAFGFNPVTQIYILSDGTPTVGETGHKQLRRYARERNRTGARITTIGLGYGKKFEGVNLLKDLAREGNGTFQYIDLKTQQKSK